LTGETFGTFNGISSLRSQFNHQKVTFRHEYHPDLAFTMSVNRLQEGSFMDLFESREVYYLSLGVQGRINLGEKVAAEFARTAADQAVLDARGRGVTDPKQLEDLRQREFEKIYKSKVHSITIAIEQAFEQSGRSSIQIDYNKGVFLRFNKTEAGSNVEAAIQLLDKDGGRVTLGYRQNIYTGDPVVSLTLEKGFVNDAFKAKAGAGTDGRISGGLYFDLFNLPAFVKNLFDWSWWRSHGDRPDTKEAPKALLVPDGQLTNLREALETEPGAVPGTPTVEVTVKENGEPDPTREYFKVNNVVEEPVTGNQIIYGPSSIIRDLALKLGSREAARQFIEETVKDGKRRAYWLSLVDKLDEAQFDQQPRRARSSLTASRLSR
jgi:hypothetical protein